MQLWGGLGVPKARSPWAVAWGRHPQLGLGADGVAVVRSPLIVAVSIAVAVAVAVPPFGKGGAGGIRFSIRSPRQPQKRIPSAPITSAQPTHTGARPLLQSGRRLSPATAWCRPACIAFACIVFASIDPACIAIQSHRLLLFPPLEKGGAGGIRFSIRSPRQPQKRIPRAPIISAQPTHTGARPLLQSGHLLSRTTALCRPACIVIRSRRLLLFPPLEKGIRFSIRSPRQPQKRIRRAPIISAQPARLTHPDRCAIPSPDARCPQPRARRPR
jgi:hypothetical protein